MDVYKRESGGKQIRRRHMNGNLIWRATDVLSTVSGNSVQRNLPSGYTQLQYIESTGASYIITDYVVNYTDLTLEYKYRKFKTLATNPLGIDGSTNNKRMMHGNIYSVSCYYGNSAVIVNLPQAVDTDYTVKFEISNALGYGKATVNGTEYTDETYGLNGWTDENTATNTTPEGLFCTNSKSDASHIMTGYLYYARYYKSGVLDREFIPAKRNSDGVAGMYETVTDTFYTSATDTAFVAGDEQQASPDVPIEILSCGDRTKNLLNPNQYIDKLGWYSNGTFLTIADKCTFYAKLPAGTYTLSAVATTNFVYGVAEQIPTVGNTATFLVYNTSSTSVKITLSKESYICVRGTNGGILPASSVMLNEGSTALDYEPYGYKVECVEKDEDGSTKKIYHAYLDEPIRRIPDSDYADVMKVTRGNDGWVCTLARNVKYKKLSSSDTFNLQTSTDTYVRFNVNAETESIYKKINTAIVSNRLRTNAGASANVINLHGSAGYAILWMDTSFSTVDILKAFVDANDFYFIAALDSPTTESITWLDSDNNPATPMRLDGEEMEFLTEIQPSSVTWQ